jgi:hypothetical protein
MHKFKLFAVAALVTLVASGVAVAKERSNTSKTDPVAATFTAERTKVSEQTCTGSDTHTYRVAREEFRGTVTSTDPRLAGTLVVRTKSVIDNTNGFGRTSGTATVLGTDGKKKASGEFVAVNSERGTLNGVLVGRVKAASATQPAGTLIANFRSQFAANGLSFTGELGAGVGQNTAIVQSFAGCESQAQNSRRGKDDDDDDDGKNKQPQKNDGGAKLHLKQGEVSAVTASSLSVKVADATITFALDERAAKAVQGLGLAVGQKVEIAYAVKGDKSVLLKVRKV